MVFLNDIYYVPFQAGNVRVRRLPEISLVMQRRLGLEPWVMEECHLQLYFVPGCCQELASCVTLTGWEAPVSETLKHFPSCVNSQKKSFPV